MIILKLKKVTKFLPIKKKLLNSVKEINFRNYVKLKKLKRVSLLKTCERGHLQLAKNVKKKKNP